MERKLSQLQSATLEYARAIRAKRDILQTLFYAVRNKSIEVKAFDKRIDIVAPAVGYTTMSGAIEYRRSATGGTDQEWYELACERSAAHFSAQDSASAMMLIIGYSLKRLRTAGPLPKITDIGRDSYNGVKLNAAIWALANQARHVDNWHKCDKTNSNEWKIIAKLNLEPREHEAAWHFLEKLNLFSYLDLEESLLATAHEALKDSAIKLSTISAGGVWWKHVGNPK
jgi:hypothetical protein